MPLMADDKAPRETIGQRLGRAMRHRNVLGRGAQSGLARDAKIATGTLSRILRDKAGIPTVDVLERLADALQVSFEWLALGRGKMDQSKAFFEVYWNRSLAAAQAREDARIPPAAIDAVVNEELEMSKDPPMPWWLRRMEAVGVLYSQSLEISGQEAKRGDTTQAAALLQSAVERVAAILERRTRPLTEGEKEALVDRAVRGLVAELKEETALFGVPDTLSQPPEDGVGWGRAKEAAETEKDEKE